MLAAWVTSESEYLHHASLASVTPICHAGKFPQLGARSSLRTAQCGCLYGERPRVYGYLSAGRQSPAIRQI
jgi:hypothetical protein